MSRPSQYEADPRSLRLGFPATSQLARARTVAAAARREAPLLGLLGLFGFLYAALGVLRHDHFNSHGFDLGIFDQAIWHWSRFEWPADTVRLVANIDGDHFHPILALGAPALWIWDDVRSLLVLQVLLFCLSAVPVYLFARSRFGRAVGLLWSAAYLLFWGIQGAIQYDFHEIAFGVPLISFGLWFTLERRWTAAALCVAPLLLVKEDLCFLVAAWGLLFIAYRQRKVGIALFVCGIATFLILTKLVMPRLADEPSYFFWSYSQFGADPFAAFKTAVTHPWLLVSVLVSPATKLATMLRLFAPFGLLTLLSPAALVLCVPLLAERMYSDNWWYWVPGKHYSATIAPVIALGALDGLGRLRERLRGRERLRRAPLALAAVFAAVGVGVTVIGHSPLYQLTRTSYWRAPAGARVASALVAQVPDGASVTAQDTLVPHLTHRARIYDLAPRRPLTDYVAIDLHGPHWGSTHDQYVAELRRFRRARYSVAWARGDFVLLTRRRVASPAPVPAHLQELWR